MSNTPNNQEEIAPIDWVSAYEYAARKGITSSPVYDKMKSGIIQFTMFGKYKMIDWNKFKDITFESNRTKYKNNEAEPRSK